MSPTCSASAPAKRRESYKTNDGGEHWDLQFQDKGPAVFLDAMAFWDADRGVAVGDSVGGALYILTTTNGGRTWTRLDAAPLPAALPNEGAFAASGTNVAVSGRSDAWIATGASRVLHSTDGGRSWSVATTPVPSGESSGIFSVAFRDRDHGVVVGGDYRDESAAVSNAAITSDGGAAWRASTRGLSGYRSVVAWVPTTTSSYVAAGPSGVDWSADDGRTWTSVSVRRCRHGELRASDPRRLGRWRSWPAGKAPDPRLTSQRPDSPALISIVVPVFNEQSTVAAVIARLLEIDLPAPREIIIVNDGSSDGTRAALDALPGRRSVTVIAFRAQPREGPRHPAGVRPCARNDHRHPGRGPRARSRAAGLARRADSRRTERRRLRLALPRRRVPPRRGRHDRSRTAR